MIQAVEHKAKRRMHREFGLSLPNPLLFLVLIAFFCPSNAFSFERFTNYASTIGAMDFAVRGDTLWVATTGGLYLINKKTGESQLQTDVGRFPDLRLNAMATDADGNLWIGSSKGYLYRRTPEGIHKVFPTYFASGWEILDIYPYGKHLIIASSRGCSVFDPARGMAIKNAIKFGTLPNPRVNVIEIANNTLYLGNAEGVAILDSVEQKLLTGNFYDPQLWRITKQDAPILAFVVSGDSLLPSASPTILFNGKRVLGDSVTLTIDSQPIEVLHGAGLVTRMVVDGSTCLVGTSEKYYYKLSLDGALSHHAVPGLTFHDVNRIHVSRLGEIWAVPAFSGKGDIAWWQGIARFDYSKWELFNSHTPDIGEDGFGWLGYHPMSAITESESAMWFGASGGNVKHYNRVTNTWGQFYVGEKDTAKFMYLPPGASRQIWGSPSTPWGKTDALAQDSGGFVWIAAWQHYLGSLICYDQRYLPDYTQTDPHQAHFRRFFSKEEPAYWMDNISALGVDRSNRIFVGGADGQLVIFSYTGSPLDGNIAIEHSSTDFQRVWKFSTTPDNTTWMATSKGLFKISGSDATPQSIDSIPLNITTIENDGPGVLWIGTSGNGILRYETATAKRSYLTMDDGLVSNNIHDLSMDRIKRQLWVATDSGVSRFALGLPLARDGKISDITVYPNPFSLSGRNRSSAGINFIGLPKQAGVSIYSLQGDLVARLKAESLNGGVWSCTWSPDGRTVPGTYFYAISPGKSRGKLLITP